jgi:putative ABC transport system ATP-binding protein
MDRFVSLEGVKKVYNMGEVKIMAAAGIDFQIKKGEFAVVVGPSGAGKTTVLNILGGMDTATEGPGGWTGYRYLFPEAAYSVPQG